MCAGLFLYWWAHRKGLFPAPLPALLIPQEWEELDPSASPGSSDSGANAPHLTFWS